MGLKVGGASIKQLRCIHLRFIATIIVLWIQCVSRSHLISVQHPDCRCLSENKQNTQGAPGNRDEMMWYLSIQMFFARNHNNCRFHRIFKTYQFQNSARRIQQFSQLLAEKIVSPDQHFVPIFLPYDQQRLRYRQTKNGNDE